ncbi:hypothetical protein [Roseimicrobium sp. ORNL1]|uniref:hypothetical protein n=1 Tax=Roseimicrobium sp. ORNL1 TaxID=2711231 RepID=UPI0013E1F4E6|nr:hypothetical protein [Roseimicrobium sp. ORNL1]QIF02375.1 hypothetical protein G5S37_12860 [Roseimicrobium sp. ORNL1]
MIFESIGIGLWLLASIFLGSKVVKSGYGPARVQLESWVKAEGLKFVSASPRLFWRGPFFLANGMQKVFRFAAMDPDGTVRRGWACCGWFFVSWKSGLEDKVVVQWDFTPLPVV